MCEQTIEEAISYLLVAYRGEDDLPMEEKDVRKLLTIVDKEVHRQEDVLPE